MPKQSRGFWACNYCGLAFDRFEEASSHEVEECHQRRAQHGELGRQREGFPSTMPPFSGEQGQDARQPFDPAERWKPRRVPLLGLQEESHLTEADTVACRNIELFEANEMYPVDQQGNRIAMGQVGLRCIHCFANMSGAPGGFDFPSSLDSVADSVRQISEQHILNCNDAPDEIKKTLDQAARKRQQSREEGGPSWHEEESNRRLLMDYCVSRCQQTEIINKFPENSGIVFQDLGMPVMEVPGSVAVPAGRYPNESAAAFGVGALPRQAGRPMPQTMSPMMPEPVGTPAGRRRERPLPLNSGVRPTPPFGGDLDRGFDAPGYAAYTPYGMERVSGQPQGYPGAKIDDGEDPSSVPVSEGYPSAGYQQMPSYDMPANFPYMQEANGDWVCKYCSHIHPQYRDPQYRWSVANKSPPPGNFIDHHLNICRSYQQSLHSHPMYDFPGPPSSFPYPPGQYGPSRQVWDPSGEQRSPPMGPPPQMPTHPGEYSTPPSRDSQYDQYAQPSPAKYSAPSHPQRANLKIDPGNQESVIQRAIDYLAVNDKSGYATDGTPLPEESKLVLDEDRLLLTDYFFYLMKQLRLCRFSEADRKTRGGKREKIHVGYGGLQCVHCADAPNSRKFFWSNVDRLANSFAEIPGHVLKCRRCPQPVKDSLGQLKQHHPAQMSKLPRGSQKVFFRRMWRRLHEQDPQQGANDTPPVESPLPKTSAESEASNPPSEAKSATAAAAAAAAEMSPATTGSDESLLMLERPTKEAAKALADSAAQDGPPSPSSRVLLAIPEDKEWLSDTDCFVRRQLEVFCATKEDVEMARTDRKYPVHEGQVGIRCIHCALTKGGAAATGQAVAFPFSISGIYESVREFQRLHLDSCSNLPPPVKAKLESLKGCSSLSSVLRKYYILAAKALGLDDTKEGIRAGGETVPLGSQAAFAFSEGGSKVSEEMKLMKGEVGQEGQTESPASTASRKRRQPQDAPGSDDSKKAARSY